MTTLVAAGAVAVAGCAGSTTSKVGVARPPGSVAANGPIAYQRFAGPAEDDRTSQIFVRMTGGAVRQLTHIKGGAYAPAWSPDGSRIAFESGAQREHELYTMNADGTDLHPLTSGCSAASACALDTAPSYSPDGRRISFERVYRPFVHHYDAETHSPADFATRIDLMVVPATGGAPKTIARWGLDPQPWNGAPRWSPDGAHIVVPLGTLTHPTKHTILGTALFVLDLSRGAQHQITPWALGAGNPDWSPDGKRIVFNSEGGHSRSTYLVRPDGTGLTRVVAGGSRLSHVGDTLSPAWSPSGKQIVFTSEAHRCQSLHVNACRGAIDTFDLYVMNADGSDVRHLTAAPQDESHPAWARARPRS